MTHSNAYIKNAPRRSRKAPSAKTRAARTAAAPGRSRAAMAVTAALLLAAVTGAAGARAASAPDTHSHAAGRARAAHVLRATDTAHLHYVSASGSLLYEQGSATGTLPGSMRAHLKLGATFTGTFTVYTRGGSISGRGSATPRGSGVYESFAGSLTVTSGTGRYAHAHGRAGLYGTFDRNNYALVVQTTGELSY